MAQRRFLTAKNEQLVVVCLTFLLLHTPGIRGQSSLQEGAQLVRENTLGSHAATQALPTAGEIPVRPLAPTKPEGRNLKVEYAKDTSIAARPVLADFEDSKQYIRARNQAVVRDNLDLLKDGELREVMASFPGSPASRYRISRSGNDFVLHLKVLFRSTNKEFFDRTKSILQDCKPQVVDMYRRAGLRLDLTLMFEDNNQLPDAEISLWPERGQTDAMNYYFGSSVLPFNCATFGHELSHLFGLPDEYKIDVNGRPNYYTDERYPKPVMACGNKLEELELYPRNVGQIIRQAFPSKYKVSVDLEKIKTLSSFKVYDANTIGAKFPLPESTSGQPQTAAQILAPSHLNEFEIQGFPLSTIEPVGRYELARSDKYELRLSSSSFPNWSVNFKGTSFFDLNRSILSSLEKHGLQITPILGPVPRLTRDELTIYEQYEIWGVRPSDKK